MGRREARPEGDRGDSATVSNASPLIAVADIGRLNLLQDVFSTLVLPPAVVRETPRVEKPRLMVTKALALPVPASTASAGVGRGEMEAIAPTLEIGADRVLLDDRQARRLASTLGLRVVSVLGILLLAKQRGVLPEVKPVIDALQRSNFHVASGLIEDILRTAGESS